MNHLAVTLLQALLDAVCVLLASVPLGSSRLALVSVGVGLTLSRLQAWTPPRTFGRPRLTQRTELSVRMVSYLKVRVQVCGQEVDTVYMRQAIKSLVQFSVALTSAILLGVLFYDWFVK